MGVVTDVIATCLNESPLHHQIHATIAIELLIIIIIIADMHAFSSDLKKSACIAYLLRYITLNTKKKKKYER